MLSVAPFYCQSFVFSSSLRPCASGVCAYLRENVVAVNSMPYALCPTPLASHPPKPRRRTTKNIPGDLLLNPAVPGSVDEILEKLLT